MPTIRHDRIEQHQVGKAVEMFIVANSDKWPDGYEAISSSNAWVGWISRNVPRTLAPEVRERLNSNLKHILVCMELKADLICTHRYREKGQKGVLFEPYLQGFIRDFCVDAVSVLEGLGAAHYLHSIRNDGTDHGRVSRANWQEALRVAYDPYGEQQLEANVAQTIAVRDKLHQDQIGARAEIDWHSFGWNAAFVPASRAIRTTLAAHADAVPETTNLTQLHGG